MGEPCASLKWAWQFCIKTALISFGLCKVTPSGWSWWGMIRHEIPADWGFMHCLTRAKTQQFSLALLRCRMSFLHCSSFTWLACLTKESRYSWCRAWAWQHISQRCFLAHQRLATIDSPSRRGSVSWRNICWMAVLKSFFEQCWLSFKVQ